MAQWVMGRCRVVEGGDGLVPFLSRKQMKIHELACASPDIVIKVVRDFLLKMLFGIAIIRVFGYFGMFFFKIEQNTS